ncbi:prophage regulatory protein [Nitratiruptor phage NrS-5]|uniref:helix-turn-helix transcriptional regulator n=1 Tax=unclassified Nitratiruptor TaxID=2624044 RepID=UPI001916BA35|nr:MULTISPECIES: AlpA family transcriptional regulator [unclassified Nitratiruptor]BCD61729.1 prophage regulatory protein [Nitratiruptor sp. YY08-13]BCD65664.1 prophage regulatory protein [Nitratiruptor sp. YY08-26]BCD83207.1 prophage regulatory protein [Nitratiruptor phage NrS-4]BCD83266.1 prophage regulatory protein [Nitratiruptor phage NrS-5]
MTLPTPQQDRLIDIKEVSYLIGMAKPTIYRYIRDGKFPKPIKIGIRASRWSYQAVMNWIEQQKDNQ